MMLAHAWDTMSCGSCLSSLYANSKSYVTYGYRDSSESMVTSFMLGTTDSSRVLSPYSSTTKLMLVSFFSLHQHP